MKILSILSLVLFMVLPSSEEDYYGKYTSTQSGLLEFFLDEEGISKLVINGEEINQKISYDYLGYFGSTLFLKIEFIDKERCFHLLKILIENDNGNFILASGFYIKYGVGEDDKIIPKNKQSFELEFQSK